jgi:hypothetical protein
MGEESDTKLITLSIPTTLYKKLEEHKEINRSALFRDAAYDKLEFKSKKVPSLVYFVSIMGFVFSITLIGISMTPSLMTEYIRGLLALLGGLLAFSTAILYYKETRKIKK